MTAPSDSELQTFMAAIRRIESSDNYRATGPASHGKYGRARGAYQIMSGIWGGWAREAGIGANADPWDPWNQDKVATYKMSQYFDKYGSWDLVSAAWFGGMGAANKIRDEGMNSVANRTDGFSSIPQYVDKAMSTMRNIGGADLPTMATRPAGTTRSQDASAGRYEAQAQGAMNDSQSPGKEQQAAPQQTQAQMQRGKAFRLSQQVFRYASQAAATAPDDDPEIQNDINKMIRTMYGQATGRKPTVETTTPTETGSVTTRGMR